MRAESRFVLLAVRDGAQDEVAKAALHVESWDLVANVAAEHRVGSFVLQPLRAVRRAAAATAAGKLQDSLFRNVATVALLDFDLKHLVAVLCSAGIAAIVLKGPALAHSVYPAPHLRPYDDIDIAVAARDIGRATAALTAEGYQRIVDAGRTEVEQASPFIPRFQLPFQSALGRTLIELHADLLQLGLPPACEADRWSRAEPLPGIDGGLMLAPCDQVVQLAVHAHKHGYNRLIWLKDLDLLARSSHPIDWDMVVSSAFREGVEGPVWYALSITQELLQTPLPPDLLARLAPAWPIRILYGRIWPRQQVASLQGRSHWRAVEFHPDSLRGMLPSLVLLGRRRYRGRAVLEAILGG